MKKAILAALLAGFVCGADLLSDVSPSALVDQLGESSGAAESTEASRLVEQVLDAGSEEARSLLEEELLDELATTSEPRRLARVSLALRGALASRGVAVLGERLARGDEELDRALCRTLGNLATRTPVEETTAQQVLLRLESLSRAGGISAQTRDEAVLAMGALGRAGFDVLMQLKSDPDCPSGLNHLFFTALARTRDPRALPTLREAAANTSLREGSRMQAATAIGQFLTGSRDAGMAREERLACIKVLKPLVLKSASDQLFVAALRSLACDSEARQDPQVREAVLKALSSPNPYRRVAALDALYQERVILEPRLAAAVEALAASETHESVRSTALAVCENQRALREGLTLE